MLCNNVIYKLLEQQISYPINVAYKIYKLKKELDEIEQLMYDRWNILFGSDYDITTFTEEEITLYNTTLQAQLDVDLFELSINQVTHNNTVELTISEMETLYNFLESK